ncbi:hypothetical protein JTE90_020765, partial [Oedothorax gibbosus]
MGPKAPVKIRSRSASPLTRSPTPISDHSKLAHCNKIRKAEELLRRQNETIGLLTHSFGDDFLAANPTDKSNLGKLKKGVNHGIQKAKIDLAKLGPCEVRDCPYHATNDVKNPHSKRRLNTSSDDEGNDQPSKILMTNSTPTQSVSPIFKNLTPSKIDMSKISSEMDDSSYDESTDIDNSEFTEVKKKKASKKRSITPQLQTPITTSNPFTALNINAPGPSSTTQPGDPSNNSPPPVTTPAGKPAVLMVKIDIDSKSLCQKITSF